MKNIDKNAIVSWCDDLVRKGMKVSVSWEGGGDDGQFQLNIDDKIIYGGSEMEDAIITLVELALDYGGFNGPFSSSGELLYNPETKCFEGTDSYTEAESTTTECHIEIAVPGELWFDRIDIDIDAQDYGESNVSVNIVILHGPYTRYHEELSEALGEYLARRIDSLVEDLDDFAGSSDMKSISAGEFVTRDGQAFFVLNEFTYSHDNTEEKSVSVNLLNN